MKVLVGPCGSVGDDGVAMGAARALAGPGGAVVSLHDIGVRNLSRPLSAAEVDLLRQAMRGAEVVGYVCGGVALGAACTAPEEPGSRSNPGVEIVAVADHVNLTWRSPLLGPNDDSAGPRFPSMNGVYLPDVVIGRLSAAKGMIVKPGVVAGVLDESQLNAFEAEMAQEHGYAAASAELVPVVIVAAHLGLRVAAAVVMKCSTEGVG